MLRCVLVELLTAEAWERKEGNLMIEDGNKQDLTSDNFPNDTVQNFFFFTLINPLIVILKQ